MSYDIPDDEYADSFTDDTPPANTVGAHVQLEMVADGELPACGPGGQLPSWDSINGYWLAYWTPEEIEAMSFEKLERARLHFYPPPGHRKPNPTDHDTFQWLVDETQKRIKQRAAKREKQ
tara:strand:- start:527 stop:886 length:360 start_codon:yes stop_codon:yes gene_type:complete